MVAALDLANRIAGADLIIIAHDRVLVYRQDPGPSKEKETVKAADGK